jgi:hypothetical protein
MILSGKYDQLAAKLASADQSSFWVKQRISRFRHLGAPDERSSDPPDLLMLASTPLWTTVCPE